MPTGRQAGGDRVVTQDELQAIDSIQRESRNICDRFDLTLNPSTGDLTYIQSRIDLIREGFESLRRRQLRAAVCKKLELPGTYAQALRIGVSPAQVSQAGTQRDNYRNFSMPEIPGFHDAKKGIALAVYFSAEDLPRRLAPALREYIEGSDREGRVALKVIEYRERYQAQFGSDAGQVTTTPSAPAEVVQTTPITEIVEPAPAAADVPFDPTNLGMYRYYMPKTFDLIWKNRQRGGDQLGGVVTFVGGNPTRASQVRSIQRVFSFFFGKYQFADNDKRVLQDKKLADAIREAMNAVREPDTFLKAVRMTPINGLRDVGVDTNTAVFVELNKRNRVRYRTMLQRVTTFSFSERGGLPTIADWERSFLGRQKFKNTRTATNFYLPFYKTGEAPDNLRELLTTLPLDMQAATEGLNTQMDTDAVPDMVPFSSYRGYTDSLEDMQNLTIYDAGTTAEPQTEEVVEDVVEEVVEPETSVPGRDDFGYLSSMNPARTIEAYGKWASSTPQELKDFTNRLPYRTRTKRQVRAFGTIFEKVFQTTLPSAPLQRDSVYRKVFLAHGLVVSDCMFSERQINDGYSSVRLTFLLVQKPGLEGATLPAEAFWADGMKIQAPVPNYTYPSERENLVRRLKNIVAQAAPDFDGNIEVERQTINLPYQGRLHLYLIGKFDVTEDLKTALNSMGESFNAMAVALDAGRGVPSAAPQSTTGLVLTKNQTQLIAPKVSSEIGTDSMTFGFEAEGFVDEMTKQQAVDRLNGMNRRGATVQFKSTRYHQRGVGRTIYKLEDDGSVQGTGNRYAPFELVTPVIGRNSTVDKFKLALDRLRSIGARNDSTGGVHIHLQASGLTWEQQRNWYLNAYLLQPFLMQCVPYSWRGRDYAQPIQITTERAVKIAQATSYMEYRRNADTARQRLLNISGQLGVDRWDKQPTYEWRFPGGGFETDTSMMLVRMLASIRQAGMQGLLQHSTTGPYGDLSRPEKREEMLEDLLGQEVYSFWISRIRDISTVFDRAKPGVSRGAGGYRGSMYKSQVSYPMPFNLY